MSTSFGTQDEATVHLTSTICSLLRSFPLRPEYPDEQKDLQPHIAEVLRQSLPNMQIVISVGEGDRKPSVNLFGTSFWPDIEIRSADKPLIAIEVKYVRPHLHAQMLSSHYIYSSRGKIQRQTRGLRRSDAPTAEVEGHRTGFEEAASSQRQSIGPIR